MKKLLLLIALMVPFSSYAKELIQNFEWLEPNNTIEIVIGEPYQLHFSCSNNNLVFTSDYADSWVHIDFTGGQHVVDSPIGYSIDENGFITGMIAGSYAIHPTGWVQAKSGVDKWLYITVVSERAEIEPNNTLDTANDITSKIRFGLYNISDIDFLKFTNNNLKWGDEVTFKIHYYGSRENPFGYKWSTFCGTDMASGGSLTSQDQVCRALVTYSNTICLEVYYDQSRSEYFLYGEEFVAEVYINGIPASEYGDNSIVIDETNFPDTNFRNYLYQQSYGYDGKITEDEIAQIEDINVSSCNIVSLKGIEYFTALKRLDCGDNQLYSLDVSINTNLTKLDCYNNQLTNLDVSNNTALKSLNCRNNQLTTLDVSNNTSLTELVCYHNQLISLSIPNSMALTILDCSYNKLTSLDLSGSTSLKSLSCGDNQLTTIDISCNTLLTRMICQYNQITTLDVSKNINLTDLTCSYNPLTILDVSNNTNLNWLLCGYNQLSSLDVSKNEKLKYLACSGNNLTSLNLSNNTNLTQVFCEQNLIKAAGMDALVESLPLSYSGKLYIMSDKDEGNVMTTNQVASARGKGWRPLYFNPSDELWYDYDGSEPSDIESMVFDTHSVCSEAYYNIQGALKNKPHKGVNIVKMKDGTTRKIVVK